MLFLTSIFDLKDEMSNPAQLNNQTLLRQSHLRSNKEGSQRHRQNIKNCLVAYVALI